MNTKKDRKQLLSLHSAQLRAFKSKVASLKAELEPIPEAADFLATIVKLEELVDKRSTAAMALFAAGEALGGTGNRTPQFVDSNTGPHIYDYLTAERLMAEHIGEMDEFQKGLATLAEMGHAARGNKELAEKEKSRINKVCWRLLTAQTQSRSTLRQAEAINATQTAILRSLGLQFWAGRGRIMRWEGKEKS